MRPPRALLAAVFLIGSVSCVFVKDLLAQTLTQKDALKALKCEKPEYPRGALTLDQEGDVVLLFQLFNDGAPRQITIGSTSGVSELDAAAITALQACKFDVKGVSTSDLLTSRSIRFNFTIPNRNKCPPLQHSKATAEAKLRGTVKLNVRIEPDGRPVGYEILASSGHKELDDIAIANALSCTFIKSESTERRWMEREYVFKAEDSTLASVKSSCRPDYPARSLRNNEQGEVILRVLISSSGLPLKTQVVKSSGFEYLDRETERAMLSCSFNPGVTDGVHVKGWTGDLKFNYKIQGQKPRAEMKCEDDEHFLSTQGYICN